MNCHDRSWVKGGTVGAVIGVLIAFGWWNCSSHNPGLSGLSCLPWVLPAFPLIFPLHSLIRLFYSGVIGLPVAGFIILDCILVGALLGYLHGKFKNRKQLST